MAAVCMGWAALSAGGGWASTQGRAETLQDLWSRFYATEVHDDAQAEAVLNQLLKLQPGDADALKSMLYLQVRTGRPEQALMYAEQLLAMAPGDEQVRLQKAYLLNGLGRNAQAHAEFTRLQQARDPQIAQTACQAAQNLRFAVISRFLSEPYFVDVYASPSYESRSHAAILPLKLRAGRYYGPEQRGQLYGFVTLNRDSRSTGGLRPDIVDENALIAGVGVNYRLGQTLPLTAYLELGVSRDLIDRNRAKYRESVVAGVTTFGEWGDRAAFCGQGCSTPASWHADLYANVAAYSRLDYNVIAEFRLRPGLNLVKGRQGVLRGYFKLASSHDSDGEFYNNTLSTGPGLVFDLAPQWPLQLRLESLKSFYLRDNAPNGRSSYHNRRVELTYYRSF